MNEIDVLIVSNTLDLATDYVCVELNDRGVKYLRLNRDKLEQYEICLDVLDCLLEITIGAESFIVTEKLKSVYYRAPIYLRDIYKQKISIEDQLSRTQWTAFVRNLGMFRNSRWMNSTEATFIAENKMLQLRIAKQIGFNCPHTIVSNTVLANLIENKSYIVKSIDTALLQFGKNEAFVYANVVTGKEFALYNNHIAPVILQDYIKPKIDIRVTVVGNRVFAVKILKNGKGVDGDWRTFKHDIAFIPFDLPPEIALQCKTIVSELGLYFGGIDLIDSDGTYFFIEINPTGEWGWLINSANLPIHKAICDFLEDCDVEKC